MLEGNEPGNAEIRLHFERLPARWLARQMAGVLFDRLELAANHLNALDAYRRVADDDQSTTGELERAGAVLDDLETALRRELEGLL